MKCFKSSSFLSKTNTRKASSRQVATSRESTIIIIFFNNESKMCSAKKKQEKRKSWGHLRVCHGTAVARVSVCRLKQRCHAIGHCFSNWSPGEWCCVTLCFIILAKYHSFVLMKQYRQSARLLIAFHFTLSASFTRELDAVVCVLRCLLSALLSVRALCYVYFARLQRKLFPYCTVLVILLIWVTAECNKLVGLLIIWFEFNAHCHSLLVNLYRVSACCKQYFQINISAISSENLYLL